MKTSDAIARYPGVQGGYPVIAGTRTPVRSVVELFRIYNGDVSEVQLDLQHLSLQQIQAALEYYRDEPDLVDEDIASQRDASRDLLTLKVPGAR